MNMELVNLLKTTELFDGLNDDQLKRLISISEPVACDKDDTIFSQGDEGDSLYIVQDGQVQVQVQIEDAELAHAHVFLGRGQIFGEMALIDRGPRSASMVCRRDGTILRILSRDAFTRLCESDTGIGYIVMRNIAADLSFKLRHRNLSIR